MLRAGQPAPQLVAEDVFGNPFDLASCQEDYVLVAFMRYAGCPYCNLAIHRLSLEYKLLKESSCDVVVFVQSDAEEIKKNIYDRHEVKPPFPIIPDMAKRFYDLYHVQSSKRAFIPGQFKTLPYWLESVGKHGFKPGKLKGDYFLVPAMFLISTRTQKIVEARYGSSFYDHETFTSIYEALNFKLTEPLPNPKTRS